MAGQIDSVAVLGAGTMGSGIATLCAEAGCRVLLLDVTREAGAQALARMAEGRAPVLGDPAAAGRSPPAASWRTSPRLPTTTGSAKR